MKIIKTKPVRVFEVGHKKKNKIFATADIYLDHDEQVTFFSDSKEFDICKKDWGFYATPSLNGRLKKFGWKSYLCKSKLTNRYYVHLVDPSMNSTYKKYLANEEMIIILELHNTELLDSTFFPNDKN